MEPPSAFARLRNLLATLYGDEISARRIVDDAGLIARKIGFGGTALNTWHAILTEAVNTGRINVLLESILAEYHENQALAAAVALYRQVAEPSEFASPVRHAPHLSEPSESSATRLLTAYLRQVTAETATLDWAGVEPLGESYGEFPLTLATIYTALDTVQPRAEPDDDGQSLVEAGVEAANGAPAVEIGRQSVLRFVNEQAYSVLLGDPGSGKTTFASFLTLCLAGERVGLAEANLTRLGEEWRHGPLLPLRVVARDFVLWLAQTRVAATDEALWRYLVGTLKGQLAQWVPSLERQLWHEGGLLIIDGFDEVPEAQLRRNQVKQAVLAFRHQFPLVRILVTSRIYAYQHQQWRLPGFEPAVLAPLGQMQIRTFIDQWYLHWAQRQSSITRQAALAHALQLRHAIETNAHVGELATRPLLLTLMASLHMARGGNLPEERAQLYEASIQLLLERWERPKHGADLRQASALQSVTNTTDDGVWPISSALMRNALEALAYRAQAEQTILAGAADIDEAHLMAALLKASRDPDLRPARIIEFIRDRAGLLYNWGEGIYRFPHRMIQEYLAACYLTSNQTEHQFPSLLVRLVRADPERWREVLLLAGARVARDKPYALWVLVGKLCSQPWRAAINQNITEREWLLAILAGQLLVETNHAQAHDLDNNLEGDVDDEDAQKRAHVVSWLLALINQGHLAVADRALAGNVLGRLGDQRPGVQLKATEPLPDIDWIGIEVGDFLVGSEPLVQQSISEPFSISRYPITVAQYQTFVAAGGYTRPIYWTKAGWAWRVAARITVPQAYPALFQLPNHPQVGISWYEAMAFCRWLSAQQGRQILLPTEWQWERAARHTDGRLYPWGNEFNPDCANTRQTNLGVTTAVGLFPTGNAVCGATDMAGNCWEWCLTAWRSQSAHPEVAFEQNLDGVERRVLRGGSFANGQKLVRCANRHRNHPDHRASNVGFRVVMR